MQYSFSEALGLSYKILQEFLCKKLKILFTSFYLNYIPSADDVFLLVQIKGFRLSILSPCATI